MTRQSSSGAGIELETIHRAFTQYVDQKAQWFLELLNNHVSIRTMHSAATSRNVPQERLLSMKILGALCALLMTCEQAPKPLDPGIFQFFVHNRDLNSLHRDFTSEWHPGLRNILDNWLALGPESEIDDFRSFFSSYMDQEV